jgi:predicted nucleic acid-binding protein
MGTVTLSMTRLYLDANAIIDLREKSGPRSRLLRRIFLLACDGKYELITSELTLAEVLVHPIRFLVDERLENSNPEMREWHDWYLANITVDKSFISSRPITHDILIRAALLRARHKSLKLPDALHLATALECNATHFMTRDGPLSSFLLNDPLWLDDPLFSFVSTEVEPLQQFLSTIK